MVLGEPSPELLVPLGGCEPRLEVRAGSAGSQLPVTGGTVVPPGPVVEGPSLHSGLSCTTTENGPWRSRSRRRGSHWGGGWRWKEQQGGLSCLGAESLQLGLGEGEQACGLGSAPSRGGQAWLPCLCLGPCMSGPRSPTPDPSLPPGLAQDPERLQGRPRALPLLSGAQAGLLAGSPDPVYPVWTLAQQ